MELKVSVKNDRQRRAELERVRDQRPDNSDGAVRHQERPWTGEENPVELGELKVTRYETADAVATITLDRPDRLNAWTGRMNTEYRALLARAPRIGPSGSSW